MAGKNARLGITLAVVAAGMVGMAFASVPAYRLFCQVTGYGGTPKVATDGSALPQVLERTMTVRFDASVNGALPWHFAPAQKDMVLQVGEQGLAFYTASNTADQPITG
ncbi:MAG: cytochrome c oxidase assembly protein, partial [Rhodospirillaceae bacterium]